MSLPADRLTFQDAVIVSAQEHIARGADGLVVGISQDVLHRRSNYGTQGVHRDAVRFLVVCAYAIVERVVKQNSSLVCVMEPLCTRTQYPTILSSKKNPKTTFAQSLGRNITPERLARLALERAGLITLRGDSLALETSAGADGAHPHSIPEYHELHPAGWDAVGVAALTFRLEENLRRRAAGDTSKCSMCGEFWSNLIGRGNLTYAVYMVSTIHK